LKFLIDTCGGRRLAEWLQAARHDVVRVSDTGLDPGDAAVLQRAADEKRILITMDKYFGKLVHRDGRRHAGIIRLPHSTVAGRIDLVRQLSERQSAAEPEGGTVTMRGTRIRILRRPT
jgi:predicted nuclease of predicted toxin-antitoxin system